MYPAIRDISWDIVMPKPRASKLETPTARRKLPARGKPYYATVSPGIYLGYRRNAGGGSWSVRAVAAGADWVRKIGLADDLELSDGRSVLSYWEAITAARKLARRQPGDEIDDGRPVTVAEAVANYGRDLEARGADSYNATRARNHLSAALSNKPVSLLNARELKGWRDGLLAKGLAPATVNRTAIALRAALEAAAAHDPRIANVRAFKIGLAGLSDTHRARNVILDDATVRRLIEAAYAHDHKLGVLVDVLAVTGARPGQAARLTVADFRDDPATPRLMMPKSGKGGSRNRAVRKTERSSVAITPALAAVLREEIANRHLDAPLLVRANGDAWRDNPSRDYRNVVRSIVSDIGLDPDVVTIYALRHSAIVRALLAGVPVRIIAASCDTSVRQIERTYSAHITEYSDHVARQGLLQIEPPAGAAVIPITRRG
jgi:integrase